MDIDISVVYVIIKQVVLARESGLCYAAMGLVTDYDSWREDTASVNMIIYIIQQFFSFQF